MNQINLNKYTNLSKNEILQIKLKNNDLLMYGRIIDARSFQSNSKDPNSNNCLFHFNRINNLVDLMLNKLYYKDYTLLSCQIMEVEYIKIIPV